MLTKLLKHELKATYRLFLSLQLILLIATFLGRLFLTIQEHITLPYILSGIFLLIYITALIVSAYGTIILYTVRFYKNLFTAEGYLMFTLPVTHGQLLWSKTIIGSFWSIINSFLLIASFFFTFSTRQITTSFRAINIDFKAEFGLSFQLFLFFISILMISASISCVTMIYFCITIGHLFSKHRILASILAYFVLSIGLQMIVLVISVFFNTYFQSEHLLYVLSLGIIFFFITSILFYWNSYIILNKKLNLT